jgi:hypothetical protein
MNDKYDVIKQSIVPSVFVPIIVGIVGIIGTLGGVFLSNWHSDRVARTQVVIEMESFIFQQRLRVIEKAANVFGKIPGIEDIWDEYLHNIKMDKEGGTQSPAHLAEKLADYHGEFDSVMYLAGIYFGPKTKAAIEALVNEKEPWWGKNRKNRNAFMAALVEELSLGINQIPDTIQSFKK